MAHLMGIKKSYFKCDDRRGIFVKESKLSTITDKFDVKLAQNNYLCLYFVKNDNINFNQIYSYNCIHN